MEIRLENVTKVFKGKDGNDVIAVNNFTDVIPDGKLVGLLGPSGCGKSTTLYMIAGLLEPTVGRIYFGENDVTDLSPEKRGIGLVFQNYALYPHMTVRQNIMFPLKNLKVPLIEADALTIEMAKLVGIDNLLDRKPSELSGGQQQRVAIARALVKKPEVLLLDEPLSNLDARLRLQTREEIKRIQKETGITTIFVTHDQEEAMSISDQIVLMDYGISQQKDEPQSVYDNPNNLFVAKFLGTPPIGLYKGKITNGKVVIGKEEIFCDAKLKDYTGEVTIAIRPEGYIANAAAGKLTLPYSYVESIGRDTCLVCSHDESLNEDKAFRIVLSSGKGITAKTMRFDIIREKCFIFDPSTGARLDWDGEPLAIPETWQGSLAEVEAAKKMAKKAEKQEAKELKKAQKELKNTETTTEKAEEVAPVKKEEPVVAKNAAPAVKKEAAKKTVLQETEEVDESDDEGLVNESEVQADVKANRPAKYHISQNKDESNPNFKKWRVRKEGSPKTIKYFDTQVQAIEFAKTLADHQDSSIVIHKVDGSIRKQDYSKNTKKEE